MSSNVRPESVSFPNQQAILDYIASHPLKEALNTPVMQGNFPNSVEKVSKFFADKTMPKDLIEKNLMTALVNDETQKLVELLGALKALSGSLEEKNADKHDKFTDDLKNIYETNAPLVDQIDAFTDIAVKMYQKVLKDLVDNAWYTPPAPGENVFQRHVKQIN